MSSDLARWGGLGGVVAGVVFVLAGILILISPPQSVSFDSFGDYLTAIILAVAFAGTLVAIAGLHFLQRGHYGRLGAVSSAVTFIGYAVIAVVTAVSTLAGGEVLPNVRLIGGVAVLIGSILLGAMSLRARMLPWWCGVLLILGFPLGDVLEELLASGSEAIVLGIVWGSAGYALLSPSGAVEG